MNNVDPDPEFAQRNRRIRDLIHYGGDTSSYNPLEVAAAKLMLKYESEDVKEK
jgi:transposase-like protein